jgi:hypothetical protein
MCVALSSSDCLISSSGLVCSSSGSCAHQAALVLIKRLANSSSGSRSRQAARCDIYQLWVFFPYYFRYHDSQIHNPIGPSACIAAARRRITLTPLISRLSLFKVPPSLTSSPMMKRPPTDDFTLSNPVVGPTDSMRSCTSSLFIWHYKHSLTLMHKSP